MENWYSDYLVAWEGLSKEVTFQQRLEGIVGARGGLLKEDM